MTGLVVIIPARGGSKRVVNKNMRLLGGKPLIQWTIEAAKSAQSVTDIYVTTENGEISTFCDDLGVYVIERSPDLAKDEVHATVPTHKALMELYNEKAYSYVAMLLPTSPFRTSKHIDGSFNKFKDVTVTSVIGVTNTGYGRENIVTINGHRDEISYVLGKKDLKQRAELQAIYAVNGAMFMAESRFFLREKNFHAGSPSAFVMSKKSALEIDTEEDFQQAETYLANCIGVCA
jgi:CMP-N,N'-diacetyllegionaminic acid synthase